MNPCPEGEGLEGFSARVCEAFHTVIDEATSREEDTVIIVTHGGSIMAIMDRYAGTGDPYYHWMSKTAAGTVWRWMKEPGRAGRPFFPMSP